MQSLGLYKFYSTHSVRGLWMFPKQKRTSKLFKRTSIHLTLNFNFGNHCSIYSPIALPLIHDTTDKIKDII